MNPQDKKNRRENKSGHGLLATFWKLARRWMTITNLQMLKPKPSRKKTN